jgi:hypothetical protein
MMGRPSPGVLCMISLCAVMLSTAAARAQECLGRIVSVEEAAAHYNPFSAVAHRNTFGVTIENTGSDACRYRIAARDTAPGSDFSFQIASADGGVLIASDGAIAAETGISSRELATGETQRLELVYSLPEGQFLSPGQFRKDIELALVDAAVAEHGGDALDTASLPLLCVVEDHLGVNIAGAGVATTVDFGELAGGDSRRIVIEARANRSFLLEIESLNGGVLVMEPPYQEWRIEYDVDLNGRSLKLPFKTGTYERGGIGGQSFPLEFRIGDVDDKRAGLYTDEITVTIRPAM